MKIILHRSPEAQEGSGAATETVERPAFSNLKAAFSEEGEVKVETTPVEKPKEEEPVLEPALTESAEKAIEEAEKTKLAEETATAESDKLKTESIFKVPGTEEAKATTWDLVKSDFGLEIKEETPAAYKEAINSLVEKTKTEALNESFMSALDKKPIAVQEATLLALNNIPLSEIEKPTQVIESFLSLSNLDLVERDLKLQGYNAEVVEQKLAELTENNQIDATANPLREFLNGEKKRVSEERVAFVTSLKEKEVQRQQQERENLATGASKYFDTFKELMGLPVNEKTNKDMQQYVINGIKEGKYSNTLSPTDLADYILYKEFRSQALSTLKTTSFAEGRDTKTKDLHNIPVKTQGMNSVSKPATVKQGSFGNIVETFGGSLA